MELGQDLFGISYGIADSNPFCNLHDYLALFHVRCHQSSCCMLSLIIVKQL